MAPGNESGNVHSDAFPIDPLLMNRLIHFHISFVWKMRQMIHLFPLVEMENPNSELRRYQVILNKLCSRPFATISKQYDFFSLKLMADIVCLGKFSILQKTPTSSFSQGTALSNIDEPSRDQN